MSRLQNDTDLGIKMRLKKIPSGMKVIKFLNPFNKKCFIRHQKKPFLMIEENSFCIIEPGTFIVGMPMNEFPELQLYSNLKIWISYI